MRQEEYEYLVAGHLLRSPNFAARNAPLIEQVLDSFFGRFDLRMVIRYGVNYYNKKGKLLSKAALKADLSLKERPQSRVHPNTFCSVVDRIWASNLEDEEHVQSTLAKEIQTRMLSSVDAESLLQSGRVEEYLRFCNEVQKISNPDENGAVRFCDGLWDIMSNPAEGIPTGFPTLDNALQGGGLCPGELLIVQGKYNVGKTQCLHHMARVAALIHNVPTLVISLETSRRNTLMRLYRGAVGWDDLAINNDPTGFKKAIMDQYVDAPLHVIYSPPGTYTRERLEVDVDRVEQKYGYGIKFIARDYGELMKRASEGHEGVRSSYSEFKALLGKKEITGIDAAQENRYGQISYFNLKKDCDVTLEISGSSYSPILACVVGRNREGRAGDQFVLRVTRNTGQTEEYYPSIG
ncbi:MAG: DnaB-like helicase C-terminal domain-containing protein [Candidatus Thorarchaeota archaeon]|jgi:hypothetical protein